MNVCNIDKKIDSESFYLENPKPLQGGSYFTNIKSKDDENIYIQLPKCLTKQGIVSTKKNKYCDLMFDKQKEDKLLEWIENIENICQSKIFEKSSIWFQNEIQKEDIEQMMTPTARLFKGGKFLLFRCGIDQNRETSSINCNIFDEKEAKVSLEEIKDNTLIIPLIHLEGIRFTSKSFDIEFKLIQIMVLNPKPIDYQTCFINTTQGSEKKIMDNLEKIKNDEDEIENNSNNVKLNNNDCNIENNGNSNDENIKEDSSIRSNNIEEVELNINEFGNESDVLKLKKPNEVYYEIYKVAREKAKHLKKLAVEAYLEAKDIKSKFMLDDMDESESSDSETSVEEEEER